MGQFVFERLSKNAFAVVVIYNCEIILAIAGGADEFAGLVGVDLASRFKDERIAMMAARWMYYS